MLKLMLEWKTLSEERKDCLGPDEVSTAVGRYWIVQVHRNVAAGFGKGQV